MATLAPRRLALAATLAIPAVWLACSTFASEDPGAPSAPVPEADIPDAIPTGEAAADLDASAPAFGAAENWSTFNLATVSGASAQQYLGATFDGRYLYFAPQTDHVARYDTNAPFSDPASWGTFDLATLPTKVSWVMPGPFDGRYVYFPPWFNGSPAPPHAGARYDTSADFTKKASWASLDHNVFADAGSPAGASAFADGYVAVAPHPAHAEVAEFLSLNADAGDFRDASAWKQVDASALDDGGAPDYVGSTVLGGFIYAGAQNRNRLVRFDSRARKLESFDYSGVYQPGYVSGAWGAVNDGRYVYLVPGFGTGFAHGRFVRYDSTKPFEEIASYELFDLATIDPKLASFLGGAYDGRFVYLCSWYYGKHVRYDTTKSFGSKDAYEIFDSHVLVAGDPYRSGAVFDGQFVYFVPNTGGVVLRFKARDSRVTWTPPGSSF